MQYGFDGRTDFFRQVANVKKLVFAVLIGVDSDSLADMMGHINHRHIINFRAVWVLVIEVLTRIDTEQFQIFYFDPDFFLSLAYYSIFGAFPQFHGASRNSPTPIVSPLDHE